MSKKCLTDKVVEFELYELNFNNSPIPELQYSPAQILISRTDNTIRQA